MSTTHDKIEAIERKSFALAGLGILSAYRRNQQNNSEKEGPCVAADFFVS